MSTFPSTRTDIHRPGAINPGDYTYVGCRLSGDEPGDPGFAEFNWQYYGGLAGFTTDEIAERAKWCGGGRATFKGVRWAARTWKGGDAEAGIGACTHCGNTNITNWVFFAHIPTGEVIAVGTDCAERMELDGREGIAQLAAFKRERAGRLLAQEKRDQLAKWRAEAPENEKAAAAVEAYAAARDAGTERTNDFMDSMAGAMRQYGPLTDRQRDAILRGIAAREARAAMAEQIGELKPVPAELLEGRVEITGRIIGVKDKETDFGVTTKMTVLDDRGFKVWATMPTNIMGPVFETLAPGAGFEEATRTANAAAATTPVRVAFMCRLKAAQEDPTMTFAQRPTKDRVIA